MDPEGIMLRKKSDRERHGASDFTPVRNRTAKTKTNSQKPRSDWWFPEAGREGGSWREGVKRHKLPGTRQRSTRDGTQHAVTGANTVLGSRGRPLRVNPKSSHHKEEMCPPSSFLLFGYEKADVS